MRCQQGQELAIGHAEKLSPLAPGDLFHPHPFKHRSLFHFLNDVTLALSNHPEQCFRQFPFKSDRMPHGHPPSWSLSTISQIITENLSAVLSILWCFHSS